MFNVQIEKCRDRTFSVSIRTSSFTDEKRCFDKNKISKFSFVNQFYRIARLRRVSSQSCRVFCQRFQILDCVAMKILFLNYYDGRSYWSNNCRKRRRRRKCITYSLPAFDINYLNSRERKSTGVLSNTFSRRFFEYGLSSPFTLAIVCEIKYWPNADAFKAVSKRSFVSRAQLHRTEFNLTPSAVTRFDLSRFTRFVY